MDDWLNTENRWESDNSTDIGCRSCLEAFSRVLFNRGDPGMMPVDIGLYFRLIKSKWTVPNVYIPSFFGARERISTIGIADRLIWKSLVQWPYNYYGFRLVLRLLSITVLEVYIWIQFALEFTILWDLFRVNIRKTNLKAITNKTPLTGPLFSILLIVVHCKYNFRS